MRIVIHKDYETLSKWVADYVVNKIKKANPMPEEPFVFGLPTGSSPLGTYKELIKLYEAGKDDFKDLPDEKAYFVLFMQLTPKNTMLEGVKKKEIIKEEISEDGKTGHILYKEEGEEKKKKFVQEDGQWKLFFGSDD